MDQYVDRNTEGKIIAAYSLEQYEGQELLAADDAELMSFLNPPPPPYTIGADIPWSRMTEQEAELVQDEIDASPIKTRNMINKATSFTFGTGSFNALKAIVSAILGAPRDYEIMGPLLASEVSANAESA